MWDCITKGQIKFGTESLSSQCKFSAEEKVLSNSKYGQCFNWAMLLQGFTCLETTSVAEALFSLTPPFPSSPLVAHTRSSVPNIGGPNREIITTGSLLSDNIYLPHLLLLHLLLLWLHMTVYAQFSNSLVISGQVKPWSTHRWLHIFLLFHHAAL